MKRVIPRDGRELSAAGMGCWAIGGPFWEGKTALGWGEVDDAESTRAVHAALEHGVTFFDTADVYGAGHSERVLGAALTGRRQDVFIATKFGNRFDESTRQTHGLERDPAYIRRALDASLQRLQTDYIDLYQIHIWSMAKEEAEPILDELDTLVHEGRILSWGWSTDDHACIRLASERRSCVSIQNALNLFHRDRTVQKLCVDGRLASINRSPLAMGLLSGKYTAGHSFEGSDIRQGNVEWMDYFVNGERNAALLEKLGAVRELLTGGGRSVVQGALGWIWSVNDLTVPIPGIRTVGQAEENAGAMEYGPLEQSVFEEVNRILEE